MVMMLDRSDLECSPIPVGHVWVGRSGTCTKGGGRRAEEPGPALGRRPGFFLGPRTRAGGSAHMTALHCHQPEKTHGNGKKIRRSEPGPAPLHGNLLHDPSPGHRTRQPSATATCVSLNTFVKMKQNPPFRRTSLISSAQWPHTPSGCGVEQSRSRTFSTIVGTCLDGTAPDHPLRWT